MLIIAAFHLGVFVPGVKDFACWFTEMFLLPFSLPTGTQIFP